MISERCGAEEPRLQTLEVEDVSACQSSGALRLAVCLVKFIQTDRTAHRGEAHRSVRAA